MAQTMIELGPRLGSRPALERRAKLLAYLGNGWHLVELGIAAGRGDLPGRVRRTEYEHLRRHRRREPGGRRRIHGIVRRSVAGSTSL
jgi:hypothetical protein